MEAPVIAMKSALSFGFYEDSTNGIHGQGSKALLLREEFQ